MQPIQVIFSHGKESGPSGFKIMQMQKVCEQYGIVSTSVDYRGIDELQPRIDKLKQQIQNTASPVILVGSSMGAYVSLMASIGQPLVKSMLLLAPAVDIVGYDSTPYRQYFDQSTQAQNLAPSTIVIHGWADEIIQPHLVFKFAQHYGFELSLVNDQHGLAQSMPLINGKLAGLIQDCL